MARHGSVERAELVVGQRRYHTVVLPPLTENLNTKTMDLLQAYVKAGGTVLCCGSPPALVDGRPSDRGQVASRSPGWKQVEPDDGLTELLLGRSEDGFAVRRAAEDRGILFHHRRRLDDGDLLFLVNTSITSPSSGVIESRARGAERWVPETGGVVPYPFAAKAQGIEAAFTLPPCGSLLLFLSREPREPAPSEARKTETVPSVGSMEIRRIAPNVLTLDYVDVTVGDETRKGAHCRQASQFVFAKHGFKQNPWFHAIQFRDEHLKKTFPADSGFEAIYRFTVKSEVPKDLQIVIERPDLYAITCNGTPVTAEKDAWWLDRAFGRINLAAAARVGENAVTIRARPFTVYHELEPAYLLGEFSLEPADSGFVVDGSGLSWPRPAGTGRAILSMRPESPTRKVSRCPEPSGRYRVELPAWYGSVAKVIVNGNLAGHIAYRPWQCDVTEWIRPGTNTIQVVVIGTLKNTLGPHHAGAVRGFASPQIFNRAPAVGPPPGREYDTIGYGLFEPFVLRHVTP